MGDDLRRIGEALDVRLGWLLSLALLAFAALLVAATSGSEVVGLVAAACGGCISMIGVRAALRPPRPFALQTFTHSPWIDTTRRVGLFYVSAGLVDVCLSLIPAAR